MPLASGQAAGDSARVVRGGAFNNNQNNTRCAYRNNNNPNNRNNNIGFRVVCSSTSFCSFHGKARLGVLRACQVCDVNPVCFQDCPPTTVCGPRRGRKDGAGTSRQHG